MESYGDLINNLPIDKEAPVKEEELRYIDAIFEPLAIDKDSSNSNTQSESNSISKSIKRALLASLIFALLNLSPIKNIIDSKAGGPGIKSLALSSTIFLVLFIIVDRVWLSKR